ncbi:MAG: DUF2284 domain-containing protein [Firmicutes bacterium]|nr:DUF2284 domain-containing protein [Bacillota bacterium]
MRSIDVEVRPYEAEVPIREYVDSCVDVEYFLSLCRQCENYGKVWTCPPYDFDPLEYWARYDTLQIVGRKILIPKDLRERNLTAEEQEDICAAILWEEKNKLQKELLKLEGEHPGSMLLSAGNCRVCAPEHYEGTGRQDRWGYCARAEGSPCRHPEKIRYSIESIGGNVVRTMEEYLGQPMQWIRDGHLPEYFFLVAGLLKKEGLLNE